MAEHLKEKSRYAISFAISLILFAFVVWVVDFREVIPALLRVKWSMFVLLLALSASFNVVLYSDRWRRMLSYMGYRHSLDEVILVHLGTGAMHLLVPIQTGEVVTAYALAKRKNSPATLYFGSIAYGKYLNLIVMLAMIGIGYLLSKGLPIPPIGSAVIVFIAITSIGVIFEIKLVRDWIYNLSSGLGKRPKKFFSELFAVFEDLSFKNKIFLLAYSFVFQFTEVFVCYLLFHHMGIEVSLPSLMVILGLVILVSSLPLTIAGAGTREALCLILLRPYTDDATAVAAGILYTFIEYIFPMVIGIPWMRSVIAESFIPANEDKKPVDKPF